MILTESVVAFVLLVIGAIFGAFWRIWGLIEKAGNEGKTAQTELAAHKLHVSEIYATKAGMQEQTSQIMRAIESVGHRIEGINERLDRAFESKPTRRAG